MRVPSSKNCHIPVVNCTFSTDSTFSFSKRPRQPQRPPRLPKTAPKRAQRWLRRPQDGPRGAQDGPRGPQEVPKRGPGEPKMAPRRPKWRPRWPQTAPRRPKRRHTRPKRAPRSPQEAQESPHRAPKRPPRGFKTASKREGRTRGERPFAGAKEQCFTLPWPWRCPSALPILPRRRSDASDAARDGAAFAPTRSRVRRDPGANLPTLFRLGLWNFCLLRSSNTSAPASVHWGRSVGEQH